MDTFFIPILTAAIGSAGHILSAIIGVREKPNEEQSLNKEFFDGAINNTSSQFALFMDMATNRMIDQLRLQHIKETVQDLQARINSLKSLLNLQTIDSKLANQLVITSLNPLQVSVEVARLRLIDYGEQETWQFCQISGTSALIAGYAFLGHDMPGLREELETVVSQVQRRILTEVALRVISVKQDFPWEQVNSFLSPDGADALLALYQSTGGLAVQSASKAEKAVNRVDKLASALGEFVGRKRRNQR